VYRQRDVDALMLVAQRHAKVRFGGADEERLRTAIIRLLIAREDFADAAAALPPAVAGPARDQLLLDILAYQAPASGRAPAPATAPVALSAAAPAGPVLVRLPPLALTRDLPQLGRRTLTLAMALRFPDTALAQALEDQAPLLQDALLTAVQQLDPALFAQPDQQRIKDVLTAAARARVPTFPADGLLVMQMEATTPTP
jgi:flagellar basal body-associated protein FliL